MSIFRLIVSFFMPLSSVVLMIFGSAFFTTFLSVYLDSEGYSRGQIGYIHAAYFGGMLFGGFQMEGVIQRVGHIQALAVFGSLATSATLLQALYPYFPAWIVLRFFVGCSLAALYIVIESWMLYHSDVKTRGAALSLYMICLTASQAVSQQVMSFVDIKSFTPFLVSALFTSLSVIPVGLSTNRITLKTEQETIKFKRIIKISPFGVTGCFITGVLTSAFYSFYPIYSVSRGIPSADLMSIAIGGGVFLLWPLGKLSDLFERRKALIVITMIALSLSLFSYFAQENSHALIFVLSFLIGGFLYSLYPISITLVCDHLESDDITKATGFLLIIFGVGSIIGPVVSSVVIGSFGSGSIFLFFSAMLGLLTLVGIYSAIQRPVIPIEEQSEFQPLPNVTPIAYEMDPRGEPCLSD